MKLLRQEGLYDFVRLIDNLSENSTRKQVNQIIKTNPESILSLLPKNLVVDMDYEEIIPYEWNNITTPHHLKKLVLTDVQKKILSIIDENQGISLEELAVNLRKDINKKGTNINRAIGGAFGGLSKKLKAYNIPEIYIVKDNGYYICPKLRGKIKNLLK